MTWRVTGYIVRREPFERTVEALSVHQAQILMASVMTRGDERLQITNVVEIKDGAK